MSGSSEDRFGPIDFLVVEFDGQGSSAEGFELLLSKVDGGVVRILDLELIAKRGGDVAVVGFDTLDLDVLRAFEGASSGLLDEDDIALVGSQISEGSVAAVVVYEELSMLAVLERWEARGARLVVEGHLTPLDIAEALDETEAK